MKRFFVLRRDNILYTVIAENKKQALIMAYNEDGRRDFDCVIDMGESDQRFDIILSELESERGYDVIRELAAKEMLLTILENRTGYDYI